jgi:hypothetical protein
MKKLMGLLLIIVFLAACSKKQETKPTLTVQNATANDFAGNWVLTVDTVSTTTNSQTNVVTNVSEDGAHFEYNNDGTGFIGATGTPNANFTYTVARGTLIHTYPRHFEQCWSGYNLYNNIYYIKKDGIASL